MRRLRRLAATLIVTLLLTDTVTTQSAANPLAGTTKARTLASPNTVRNPIREDAPDPSIRYYQGSYYLTYTAGSHIVITKATSIAGIQDAAETVVWEDDTPSRCCNMWAPELHLLLGRWYIYYTADDMTMSRERAADDMDISHHRMYVLESVGNGGTDPMGPYSFKGQLNTSTGAAIDGTVLQQPDQSLYFIWSGVSGTSPKTQNLYLAPMSDPWTISGRRVLISRPEYDWETVPARDGRSAGSINEAPAILRHGGRVFLTYSAGGCEHYDYTLGMLALKDGGDPRDPGSWTKKPNPVFAFSDDHWVWGPGSNGFFSSPDNSETWLVYHAVTSSAGTRTGECGDSRSTRVQKVSFNADGMPNFGEPVASWQSITLPSGDPGTRVVPDGRYQITAAAGGRSLGVKGCVMTSASMKTSYPVEMWDYQGNGCQQWNVAYLGDGSYKLTEVDHNGALEVHGCRGDNAAPVTVSPYDGGDCQKWHLDSLGDDMYRISSRASGKSLNVSDCSRHNGATVNIWPYWGDADSIAKCQRWQLNRVG